MKMWSGNPSFVISHCPFPNMCKVQRSISFNKTKTLCSYFFTVLDQQRCHTAQPVSKIKIKIWRKYGTSKHFCFCFTNRPKMSVAVTVFVQKYVAVEFQNKKKETGSKRKQLPLPSPYRCFSDVIIETLETLESETCPTFCLNLSLTSVHTHKPKPSVQD